MKLLLIITVLLLDVYCVGEQTGLLNGTYKGTRWGYYTILSNLLVIVYFFLALLNELFGIVPLVENAVVSFTVMMSIILTFMIFHFMLMKIMIREWKEGIGLNPYRLGNLGVHYICPILTLVYFFLFIDRSDLKVWQGVLWLLSPTVYLLYAALRAHLGYTFNARGDRWPYWFMNFDKLGFWKVIRNLLILMAGFGLLGLLIAYISIILR